MNEQEKELLFNDLCGRLQVSAVASIQIEQKKIERNRKKHKEKEMNNI